jgi:DNA-binding Lrp family transcriptional regulator
MFAAYVLIDLNIEVDFPETLDAIRSIPGVKQAHLVVGPADCIAFVESETSEEGLDALKKIRAVKGVSKTDTRTASVF